MKRVRVGVWRLLSLLMIFATVVTCTVPAQVWADFPAPLAGQLNIVHLGDSYSAGNGAGRYYGTPECMRSFNNWGQVLTNRLYRSGVKATYLNRACSGGTIAHMFHSREMVGSLKFIRANTIEEAQAMLEAADACGVQQAADVQRVDYDVAEGPTDYDGPQFSYRCIVTVGAQAMDVDANTDLVLVTFGGNDAKFGDIVASCFGPETFPGLPGGSGVNCKQAVSDADDKLSEVMESLRENLVELIESRMSGNPNSKIVLSSYPLLAEDYPYGYKIGDDEFYPSVQRVRKLGLRALDEQRRIVREINLSHPGRVVLLDSLPEAFEGHEPHPILHWTNKSRWINEFMETEGDAAGDDPIQSIRTMEVVNFWHPNIRGHREWGDLVAASGVTPNAPLIGDEKPDMDVVFVVDATESMRKNWRWTVSAIGDAMGGFDEERMRFALVAYQDQPEGGGAPGNYPAKVIQGFTSDRAAITQALDELPLASAGDPAESVLSGIKAGLDLQGWRPGASKTMIVVGDGPPKDPEPVSGLTWESLRKQAVQQVQTRISVVGEESIDSESLSKLATDTGGRVSALDDLSRIGGEIKQDLQDADAGPVAWLQGPFVDKIGNLVTFNASASYAQGSSRIVKYEFDLDGDGVFETPRPNAFAAKKYMGETISYAAVRVTDDAGRTAFSAAPLSITRDGDVIPDAYDNCPDASNPSQQDVNENQIGDACESPDNIEIRPPDLVEPPTPSPSGRPSTSPEPIPTSDPSRTPSQTAMPSPSAGPSQAPPSAEPTGPGLPTPAPSDQPSSAVPSASNFPSLGPSVSPTQLPSPSLLPSPTRLPTSPRPTDAPTTSAPSATSPLAPSPGKPAKPTPPPRRPGPPNTGAEGG